MNDMYSSDTVNSQNGNADGSSKAQNAGNAAAAGGSNTDPSVTGDTRNNAQSTDGSSGASGSSDQSGAEGSENGGSTTAGDGGGSSQSGSQGTDASSGQSSSGGGSSSRTKTTGSWEWSSDNKTASYVVKTGSGNVVSNTQATVTSDEEPATCITDGKITYNATVNVEGRTYTDVQTTILPALGHLFGTGVEITLEGGQKAVQFECVHCHELIVISTTINEQ